jgi:hypothetical protein
MAQQMASPIEIDMRDLLRAKELTSLTENKGAVNDFSALISQTAAPSAQDIDLLVGVLRQMREKLDKDGDRLQRDIGRYVEFSEAVAQLTEIISDGMVHIEGATALQKPNESIRRQHCRK